ncbi:MAG: transcription elongation factor GreA [Gemmatimonadales bacterium]|nr:MAG: transcription elongation factor GreA [Gemmatimonadales bacterium]
MGVQRGLFYFSIRRTAVLEELKNKLSDEAEALIHELNVTLPHEIERAVAQGDLRENSEYTAALERQRFVGAKLEHISRRLSEISNVDLDTIPEDRIGFGSKIEVRDLDDGEIEEYILAFGDMINFENSEISMASPIGKALLGRIKGDVLEISLPGGLLRYEVVSFLTLHKFSAVKKAG